MNIDEIALRVVRELNIAPELQMLDFAHRLIAAVQEAQEPVAIAEGRELYWIASKEPKDDEEDMYLYTFPLAAAIPEGMVLVPREPTEAMIEQGAMGMASFQENSVWPDSWEPVQVKGMRHDAKKAWRYMIDAAQGGEVMNTLHSRSTAFYEERIAKLEADLMASIRREELLLTQIGNMRAENAELRKDAARLDWLESNPRHAQILIESRATDCVFYGISCAELVKLRDAIDAAMGEHDEQAR